MNLPILAPLSWVYGSVVRSRNARFDKSAPHRLRWPVISVGNLSVGGTGKTPFVIALAKLLQREKYQVDVLSRGYGRAQDTVERVDPAGSAARFGDEPLLIAQTAGVPVYVGASRYAAGLLAESDLAGEGSHLHLLDDGMQHRRLARDIEIVLLHRSDQQQRLLPAGRLREPLSSLGRADVIVLRQEDEELTSQLRRYTRSDCHFWLVRRKLTLANKRQKALAFCAIARPEEFFQALATAGVGITERMAFRDHHSYMTADMERLAALGKGCDALITTQKDAVKLDAGMRARLNAVAPLETADLTVEIEDECLAVSQLVALLDVRKSSIVTAK
jgi:tetraacyldisaccharide 4'-kinase